MLIADCILKSTCKKAGECPSICHPNSLATMLLEGSHVPLLYRNSRIDTLPFKESNKPLYAACERYKEDILNKVLVECKGLFLTGSTGVGKSTVVCTLAIEYLIARVIDVYKNKNLIESIPILFMNCQKLQEAYNLQYRIKNDLYAKTYLQMLHDCKAADLLILDDICLRNITEVYQAELYGILDTRLNERKCTFATSNLGYSEMLDILGERNISRLQGLAGTEIKLTGTDFRKEGLHGR